MSATTAVLKHQVEGERIEFWLESELHRQDPPGTWAQFDSRLHGGLRAHTGSLLRLFDAGVAQWDEDRGVLSVPAETICELSEIEAAGLGLPSPLPYIIEVEAEGRPTDPDYRIRHAFRDPGSGRPIVGPRRRGPFLDVGRASYLLHPQMLQLLRASEELNRGVGGDDRVRRLEAVADFQAKLPSGARQGPHFRNVQLVRAASVGLRPFLNKSGSADFEPCLFASLAQAEADVNGETETLRSLLPPNVQETWARLFRTRPEIGAASPAGDGWIVLASEPVREVLRAIQRLQQSPKEVRARFIQSPQAVLKEELAGRVEAGLVEQIFVEADDFSSRVREIGLWQPRVLPYLRSSGREWLPPDEVGVRIGDVELPIQVGELTEKIERVEAAIARGEAQVEIEGQLLPANNETLEALRALEEAGVAPIQNSRERRKGAALTLLILENLEDIEFQGSARASGAAPGFDPSLVRSSLMPHQIQGVGWLREVYSAGQSGALLADDMGLGKTLQVLAFLSWIQRSGSQVASSPRPILVVAPSGLLRNWLAEHEDHLSPPGLGGAIELHGAGVRDLRLSQAHRGAEIDGGLPALDLQRLREANWVLTTYETLRDYQHSLGRIRWLAIVLDEAQKIKNPEALLTHSVKAMNADFWIAMTGTPVENRVADLWCIVDAVRPGHLGALRGFCDRYEPAGGGGPARLEELREKLLRQDPPLMLRRMKSDYLEGLPEIHFHREARMMPKAQAEAYESAVAAARSSLDSEGILAALHALRSVSLHPLKQLKENDEEFIAASARWSYLFEKLDEIRQRREKALVFVDSLAHQGILAELVQRRYGLTESPLTISGEVPGPRRKQRVDLFQERGGFDVMILSPRAGGVGLTLTAANHVVHLSRWWNPAVEDQCTDRVYRIGQTREVNVYVPLAIHPLYGEASFDVQLDQLLASKRSLSRTLLAPAVATDEELKDLLNRTIAAEAN